MEQFELQIISATGEIESCQIWFARGIPVTLNTRSARFGDVTFTDDNLFAALCNYRRLLEKDGFLLLCHGARKDAYPSRMALEMGGGRKVYLTKMGQQARREDLVDIFEAATFEQVCSVDEQRAAHEAWLRSLVR